MDLYGAIKRRRSVRKYADEGLAEKKLDRVEGLLDDDNAFQPEVSADAKLIHEGKRLQDDISGVVADYGKVEAPHYLALTSEDSEAGHVEIGYRYEFLVLALTAEGIGTCWIGKGFGGGALEDYVEIPEGQTCKALIAFGFPPDGRRLEEIESPKRKGIDYFIVNRGPGEMDEEAREIIDCLRRAPSSINSQPWGTVVEEQKVHLYRRKRSGLTRRFISSLTEMNRIDSGIGLCHMEVAGGHVWGDVEVDTARSPNVEGMSYVGSVIGPGAES